MFPLAHFPGVDQLLEASYRLRHGIRPSVAVLTIAPQPGLTADVGTLSISFGDTSLAFPDCKVDHASFARTESGDIWQLALLDRRWRWRYGQISGEYNVHGESFSLERERTPQELAALCLEAMGESDFDVADLPSEPRPCVRWNFDVPAEALAALCDTLSCRVVLQLDNRVAIRRIGVGAELPADDVLAGGATLDPPDVPSTLAVVCGVNLYQVDFPLEAVGLAAGGPGERETLRPIDELNYQPSGGWGTADVPFFHQVEAASRPLARQSVFRCYRIRMPLSVIGYRGPRGDRVEQIVQILPIDPRQLATLDDGGRSVRRPAIVYGVWYRETAGVANNVPSLVPLPDDPASSPEALASIYTSPYRIDAGRGLVIFAEPVYRNAHPSATGGSGFEVVPAAAELVLRATCRVRDLNTLSPVRHLPSRQTSTLAGGGTCYLPHEELVVTHRPRYGNTFADVQVQTNASEVDALAESYLEAVAQRYIVSTAQVACYAGLKPIDLDGAIRQVTFHIGQHGTTTSAARQSDRSLPLLAP